MLKDKRCIITGAAGALASGLARQMAEQGARVFLADAQPDLLEVAARELHAPSCVVDYGKQEDLRDLVCQAAQSLGGVDILVNCANMQKTFAIDEFPEAVWDEMIAMLLTAPFLLTKYVWPHMKAQQWGRILYFNSIHGMVASEFKTAYVAAKHGLGGLTRAAAIEGGRHGITVNSVCPSYVWSPGTEQQISDTAERLDVSEQQALEDYLLQKAAIKTLIQPQEVFDTMCFLCSSAANHITGSMLTMDGGYTAG